MLVTMPITNAVDIPSYAFLSVKPTPIGVNQPLSVIMWLSAAPPTAAGAQGERWEGFEVAVTKPDGSKETLGPFSSDPVGSAYTYYVPDQVGTYYFKFSFPGQQVTGTEAISGRSVDYYYKPSSSPDIEITVQADPILSYPDWPLPDENTYWERPIDSENREWSSISGNWLQGSYNASGRFNPYTEAPDTAHVVWKKAIMSGGLIGGEFDSKGYYTGMSYENKWDPPVIMNGKLYYNQPLGSSAKLGLACVDIRTGEELWFKENTTIVMGQIYNFESPNQHGGHAYLWGTSGTTWKMYDAFTGGPILDIVNAAGALSNVIYSQNGDMLIYSLGADWVALWNSSRVFELSQSDPWSWRPPTGGSLDWQKGIQWNVTVPAIPGQQMAYCDGEVIIASVTTSSTLNTYTHMGYSAKTGERLWIQNRTNLPAGFTTTNLGGAFASGIGAMGSGVYVLFTMGTMQWWGYDAYTGEQLWGPTEPYTDAWGMYAWGLGSPALIAYDKLYAATFDGMVHCYDVRTGDHLWDYTTGSSGFETPYGTWPFSGGLTVADGKIYVGTSEHSPNTPLWRGEKLHCIDAETGEGIWAIRGWFNGPGIGDKLCAGPAVADGYLLGLNVADGQIYSFGKGKTATTVSAPQTAVKVGTEVLIQGTVTAQSPAAQDTPAIADECMTAWMEYLHMQKPKPTDVTGVPVHLTAIDPNGNFHDIGTTISDELGNYAIDWTPPVSGTYKVTATFEGSGSYYSSQAGTYFVASQSASPDITQPSPTSAVPPPTSALSTTTYVGIAIAVVVIIAAAAALILRKRK
jgi:hypothetical protein